MRVTGAATMLIANVCLALFTVSVSTADVGGGGDLTPPPSSSSSSPSFDETKRWQGGNPLRGDHGIDETDNNNSDDNHDDGEDQHERGDHQQHRTHFAPIRRHQHRNRNNNAASVNQNQLRRGRGQRQRQHQRRHHHHNNKQGVQFMRSLADTSHRQYGGDFTTAGKWPPVFNVALKATATVNATCGTDAPQDYCKMVDAHPHKLRAPQCGVCDASSAEPDKHHPITHAIDGTNRWWQSPALSYGKQFERVTVTLDLGQIYEIAFITLKSAISPRPASWILERSLDATTFAPWQYFGLNDEDCRSRYGLPGYHENQVFEKDTDIMCSTQFAKAIPLENGEIQIVLANGRPGANTSSTELLEFTLARYIRFRFEAMHVSVQAANNVRWLLDPQALDKRSFYSLRYIRVGGRCVCSGHAASCTRADDGAVDELPECECLHNTCGSNCERCCPLYNQRPYRPGSAEHENRCEQCECYGHATECRYSSDVDQRGLSVDTHGHMNGGGVCLNCTKFTAGTNCEQCVAGYYRPSERALDSPEPCVPCDCHPAGSSGQCAAIGGACECREGFAGPRCDECAVGFMGALCERCACDRRGTMPGGECETHCQCKLHVEGKFCDQCTPGYFGLSSANAEGCMKCYCSGVGMSCRSETVSVIESTLENWQVSDIARSVFATPIRDKVTGSFVFGMDELADIEAVYWVAPDGYCGNRLASYGAALSVRTAWTVIRGDTSGKATVSPNVIIIGRNGMRIAYGDAIYDATTNATMRVRLTEDGWYHVPRTVKDIVTRLRRTEDYRGDPVTRFQFMGVLSDVESILFRGTFHTDQGESMLESVTLEAASVDSLTNGQSLVEACACPIGYTGLSCETCAFGFVRALENTTTHEQLAKCFPCSCNGHAETCNLATGDCGVCEHNTFGERCERCALGYYGDAKEGTSVDCKPCACPLVDASNNFSPSCQLNVSAVDVTANTVTESDYICTQCPGGYTGDHCELCDDGYFGTPTTIGSACLPCECDGGPCDLDTGNCIVCLGNTEGWRCERCKSGFWAAEPTDGCEPCDCSSNGAIDELCHVRTGQCTCRPQFDGLSCDECQPGYANTSLDCAPCDCSPNGSASDICDRHDGQCACKDGVEGLLCDACAEEFYNLTEAGCAECNCSRLGALSNGCQRRSGQCPCRSNVGGRACDRCDHGTWNLESGAGCVSCQCNAIGSRDGSCNQYTGECNCKPGVGGAKCDRCLDGFYAFSNHGCKRCDSCDSESHVCDPDTGRCVCPPHSRGVDCRLCTANTWGWQFRVGCRPCDCDRGGSIGQSCDLLSGQCVCREGYTGLACDLCASGYYGFPHCRRCSCDHRGTIGGALSNTSITTGVTLFDCDEQGQCLCKELVTGLKCEDCRQSTFGLAAHNPDGCTRCFCFGRSGTCEQSRLSWGQIRAAGSRNLSVSYTTHANNRVNVPDYEYVVVIQMEGARMHREDATIDVMNELNLIPSSIGNVSIGAYNPFHAPLYFQLPPQFLGDQTTSYGGTLRYTLTTTGCDTILGEHTLRRYPLIQIHAHQSLILDYFGWERLNWMPNATFAVHMHETAWRVHSNGRNITRAIMMTALQNVKHVFLRGTTWADFTQVVISNVTMDTAIYVSGATNNVAVDVEMCRCPADYAGLSCQDPAPGYYRWKNTSRTDVATTLEDFVGRAVQCQCNGRSDRCDIETGHCTHCREHTGGRHCGECAEGFYGNPLHGSCQSCPCPETRRNFAKGCTVRGNDVSCICKPGYTGALCDRCVYGYFGDPQSETGTCEACDCAPDGIVSDECDDRSGQCNCRRDVVGRRCDKCALPRHVLQDGRCRACDNCTTTLLDRIDGFEMILLTGTAHIASGGGIPAPWPRLENFMNATDRLGDRLADFVTAKDSVHSFNENIIKKITSRSTNANNRAKKLIAKADDRNHGAEQLRNDTLAAHDILRTANAAIAHTIDQLNAYGTHDHHISLPLAVREADDLLADLHNRSLEQANALHALQCARTTLATWSDLAQVAGVQQDELHRLHVRLSQLNYKIVDLDRYSKSVAAFVEDTATLLDDNQDGAARVAAKHDLLLVTMQDIAKIFDNTLLADADSLLDQLQGIIDSQRQELQVMRQLNAELKASLTVARDELHKIGRNWMPEAKVHAEDLWTRATEYTSMFKSTKDGAVYAMLASSAHQNITDAIEAARSAAAMAIQAAADSEDELYLTPGETVIERGMKLLNGSRHIKHDAAQEIERVKVLQDSLVTHQTVVDGIKKTIWHTGLKNNEISSKLQAMLDGGGGNVGANNAARRSIKHSTDTAIAVSDQMHEVRGDVANISAGFYKLKEQMAHLEPQWDIKLGLAEENVSESLSNMRNTDNVLATIESISKRNNDNFRRWNATVSTHLQTLRDKISRAKHAAETIRVSVESGDGPKCVRSYVPPAYGLTTSTTIKMNIALGSATGNSPLLYIQGADRKFIALEMVRRKVRLVWNLGGETALITHPVDIQTRNPKYDDAWYQIEANRTMNIGSLTVRRMQNTGALSNATVVSGASNVDHTKFSVLPVNRLWIGGVPHELRSPVLQAANGLDVTVHRVYIDQKQIGLWHFAQSDGECRGAMLGAQETALIPSGRYFNGEGYAVVTKTRIRRKNSFAIQMTFKTLDENALLFLAVDEKNNRSISLTLFEGRIVFRIDYGGESKLEINTTKKFNTGVWVNVEAAREFTAKRSTENGSLKVNNEEPRTGSPTAPISAGSLPELSNAFYYLGGVPPGFKSGTTKAPGADHAFLGCMKDVQVNGETYDPLESATYFGVESTCKETITKAGFYGNGFVELPSHSLRKRGNFGFVFRTLQPECLLMLSAFPPSVAGDYDAKDLRGNYSVSLLDGRVNLWMDAGRGRVELVANDTVNDGEYHVVIVQKIGRRIELRVDDRLHATKNLPAQPFVVNMPDDAGGLYFGGAPDEPEFDSLAPTFDSFEGSIKDVIFNNRTVSFDSNLIFNNVHLGRAGPPMGMAGLNNLLMKTEPIGRSFTTPPEGCHRVGSYSYEPYAFKFGDGVHSHAMLNFQRNMFQRNFHVQFDFRTFYPNGVIFIAPGSKDKPKHHVLLNLRDGQLSFTVRGRKKEELTLPPRLNDGHWHRIVIVCVDRKVTMSVEIGGATASGQFSSAQMRIPKKIVTANTMYVGGIPEATTVTMPVDLVTKLEEFKGCVRRFTVNNTTQDLARPGRHINVGQCFPRVEKGSYFPGDAYAVYKRNFHVGKYLEFELEFRTSELNGVLLSVSEPNGFPALSLEVHNGKVVMSCDLGDGNPFHVSTNYPSKFSLCDNRWHNISALYDSEQIALRIDQQASLIANARHRMLGKVQTKSPLYIGGIPDTAPSGTLLTRENFKGCIRNIVVRNEIRDWTDMDSLHNVLLSECLAIN